MHFHVPGIILILLLIMIGGAAYAATSVGRHLEGFLDGMPWYRENRMTYSRNWESDAIQVDTEERLVVENSLGRIELAPAEGGELHVQAVIRAPENGPARDLADRV